MVIIAAANNQDKKMVIEATLKGKVAHIVIDGYFADWNENSAKNIRAKIAPLKKKGANKALVLMTSSGGSVFTSRDVANILKSEFGAENVLLRIGAVAASAASRLVCEFNTEAYKSSQFMIHKPRIQSGGTEDELASKLKLAQDTTTDYVEAYAAKTGKSLKDVRKMFSKGDTWLTAQEALDEGLINSIIDADQKITAQDVVQLAACGAPVMPEITSKINKPKIREMKLELLIATLGMPEGSTEADVTARIDQLKVAAAKADTLKAEAELKAENDEKAKITAMLNAAEKDKKFTGEMRATYQAMAEADFNNTEKIIASLPAIEKPVVDGKKKGDTTAGREAWTLADYQEKDPEAFDKLPEEKQETLMEAHYASND